MDVLDAIVEQHRRRSRLDERLPSLDRAKVAALLASAATPTTSAVRAICDADGVIALAWPAVEHYDPDSDKLAYYERDTGTTFGLTIRQTGGPCLAALNALLTQIEQDWRAAGATGANLVWPCREMSIDQPLAAHGFAKDACIAVKPMAEPRPAATGRRRSLSARLAVPDDEPMLLRLQEAVLAAHIPDSPFARRVPAVRARFHDRLAEMWAGRTPADGAPLVVVAEDQGQIVGMSECFVRRHDIALDMLLPDGLYGYVNTFGVLPERRGGGAGRFLADAVERALSHFDVRGIYLYYSYYNTAAMAFWSKVGYSPLWRTYQCRRLIPSAR
ncbi:Protein N-acetyltransferase, RimJ/RimL family [Micromonospora sediminimaris]|nr:Protein N-acetyltransferase, RimJ/RimL family [Micromonospora sediminimaris]